MKTGNPYAPLQREYTSRAGTYDSRWKRYIAASIKETLGELKLEPGTRLLDLGCGTGVLLERLALQQPEARLFGSDLSYAMLVIARNRLAPATVLFHAPAESLPLVDASMDVLISTSVVHFVREPGNALNEMRRVLRPGGHLIVTDWCRDYLTMRLLNSYLKYFNAAHHHTYGSGEFASLLDAHGFKEIHVSRHRIDWFWGLFTASAICPAS